MIYEYTKQDIPKAWKAGYRFVETDVAPRFIPGSSATGKELIETSSESTLRLRSAMYPSDMSIFKLMGQDFFEAIVREGTPLRDLNEEERSKYGVYQTLFSAVGDPAGRFNIHASIAGDAFSGLSPPSTVELPQGLAGEELYREILRRTTPVMEFHVPSDSYREAMSQMMRSHTPETYYSHSAKAMKPVFAAAHEFAHSSLQPGLDVPPGAALRVAEDSSKLLDTLVDYTVMRQVMREVQADLFAAAVSFNPRTWVSLRYGSYAAPRGLEHGKKVDVPVFSPEDIENPNSPIYSYLRERIKESISFVDKPVGMSDLESKAIYDDALQAAGSGTARGVSNFAGVLSTMSSISFMRILQEASQSEDQHSSPVMSLIASRLASVSYAVGKARPDLIGKTVQVDAEGNITTPSGEVIDPGDILPDIKLFGMIEPEEIHPVLLERAFQAQEIYNRAREAVQKGYRFEPPPIQAADVVNTWRQEFERIVR